MYLFHRGFSCLSLVLLAFITLCPCDFARSQCGGASWYDVTTQPPQPASSGTNAAYASTTNNLGHFIVGKVGSTLRLMGNSGNVIAQTGPITVNPYSLNPDNIALASNHNSQLAIVNYDFGDNSGAQNFIGVRLLTNDPSNGSIHVRGNILESSLPGYTAKIWLPNYLYRQGNTTTTELAEVKGLDAAMDNQYLYITWLMRWPHNHPPAPSGSDPGAYFVVYSVINLSNPVPTPPINIQIPGGSVPAASVDNPTVALNRWNHTANNAQIGFSYFDGSSGSPRERPAVWTGNDAIPVVASVALPEPSFSSPHDCEWVRVVEQDDPGGIIGYHYFYRYYAPTDAFSTPLYSTDGSTVYGPISTHCNDEDPAPGFGSSYGTAYSTYLLFQEWDGTTPVQLTICRQQGLNKQVTAIGLTTTTFASFTLGANQMGILSLSQITPGSQEVLWRSFCGISTDIAENTVATGLTKLYPNLDPMVLGVGVGTRAKLNDTLRILHSLDGTPQTFQFSQPPVPSPQGPVMLWAGEHPGQTSDVDPGNARGHIIMDNAANIDFGANNTPPVAGAILQARSDGSIEYNGALFTNLMNDIIGATGETRVADTVEKYRGIWYMNAPCTISGAATFGGTKGQIRFLSANTQVNTAKLTINGANSALTCDHTFIYLGSTKNDGPLEQIEVDGSATIPVTVSLTNCLITTGAQSYDVNGDLQPGCRSDIFLDRAAATVINNNDIRFSKIIVTNPLSSFDFDGNTCSVLGSQLEVDWTDDQSTFAGQINANNNNVTNGAAFGSHSVYGDSRVFVFHGINVAADPQSIDQHKVIVADNSFLQLFQGDDPVSTAIKLEYGTNAAILHNTIKEMDIGIWDDKIGNAGSFVCSNHITASTHTCLCDLSDAGNINGTTYVPTIGILEEGDHGYSYIKLNWLQYILKGYVARGFNSSNLIENSIDSCYAGAVFEDYSATILNGSHTGTDDYGGFNQFLKNTDYQIMIVGNSTQTVQPQIGGGDPTDDTWGENTFVLYDNPARPCYHIGMHPANMWNSLATSLNNCHWTPAIAKERHNMYISDPNILNIEYRNVCDGDLANPVFSCGGGFETRTSKRQTLAVESVDTSSPLWLYYAALKWDGVDPQKAMDTMRLFVERYPHTFEAQQGLGYTVDFTTQESKPMPDKWIEEYNWLASVYTLDSSHRYRAVDLANMASCEIYFDRNGACNLWYNYTVLFPDSMDVALAAHDISSIRKHQSMIPEDTTPFYLIPIPPQPYGKRIVHHASDPASLNCRVYPNPADNNINIEFMSPAAAMGTIDIYDILGHLVKTQNTQRLHSGASQFSIDSHNLSNGSYLLRIAIGSSVQTVHLYIEH